MFNKQTIPVLLVFHAARIDELNSDMSLEATLLASGSLNKLDNLRRVSIRSTSSYCLPRG